MGQWYLAHIVVTYYINLVRAAPQGPSLSGGVLDDAPCGMALIATTITVTSFLDTPHAMVGPYIMNVLHIRSRLNSVNRHLSRIEQSNTSKRKITTH